MKLYIAVTPDKYELPIAVAESAERLGVMVGVNGQTILTHISRAKRGKIKKQRYFRLEVSEEDYE